MSTATSFFKSGSRSAISAVLPPGAAQASRPAGPAPRPKGNATHCAPKSCTETSPARSRAARARHRASPRQWPRARALRRAPRSPPLRSSSRYLGGGRRRLLTRSHIGAWASLAASNWVQRTGQSARNRSANQIGAAWRVAGLRAISSVQRLALPQVAAQHGVDQPRRRACASVAFAVMHRRIDHGIFRRAFILEFVKRHGQKRAHQKIQRSHGCRQQLCQNGFVPKIAAHGAIAQGAHRGEELRVRRGKSVLQRRVQRHALTQHSRHRICGQGARTGGGVSWDAEARAVEPLSPRRIPRPARACGRPVAA